MTINFLGGQSAKESPPRLSVRFCFRYRYGFVTRSTLSCLHESFSGTRLRAELKSVACEGAATRAPIFPECNVSLSCLYAPYVAKTYLNNCAWRLLSCPLISAHPVYRSATWLFPLPYRGTSWRRISTRRGFYLTFTRSTSSLNRFRRPYATGRERVFHCWLIFFIARCWRETH